MFLSKDLLLVRGVNDVVLGKHCHCLGSKLGNHDKRLSAPYHCKFCGHVSFPLSWYVWGWLPIASQNMYCICFESLTHIVNKGVIALGDS